MMTKKKKSATEALTKFSDFRNFLWYLWRHLKLPPPTKIQYEIANYLQNGEKRIVIQGFRGVGKSWITSAFTLHQLLLDPQKNILVVSASKARADEFSQFCQRLLYEVDILQHLIPTDDQRQSKISFDVRGARAAHAPSVKSLGITSQLSGNRADVLISDDVEILNNSATQGLRDKLSEAVREYDAIIKPVTGRIIVLGTPMTEMSLYNQLPERGYKTQIFPARYPTHKQQAGYGNTLAPIIKDAVEADDKLIGKPTDNKRFDEVDLQEREASYGRTGFNMQFMLDCNLSDINKFPLKLSDLVVMNFADTAPEKVIWATSPELRSDLPNVGMAGDYYYRPMQTQGDWLKFQGSVMSIDPAGTGRDELAYSVVHMLNGNLFVAACSGIQGGYEDKNLQRLVDVAKKHKVNQVICERNWDGGMFTKLITPYFIKDYPVTVEEVQHSTQKELRIIDVLEPLANQHRLIFSEKVIQDDYASTQHYSAEQSLKYQLMYQFTRMTRERGALKHDDRLDCLSMSCQYWVDQLAKDQNRAMADRKEALFQEEYDRFMDGAIGGDASKPKQTNWMNVGTNN